MIAWLIKFGASKALPWLVVALVAGGGLIWLETVKSRAYDRGYTQRDIEAREVIARLEQRLAQRMRENEGLTDPEIDCQLRRLRNPKAECGK